MLIMYSLIFHSPFKGQCFCFVVAFALFSFSQRNGTILYSDDSKPLKKVKEGWKVLKEG